MVDKINKLKLLVLKTVVEDTTVIFYGLDLDTRKFTGLPCNMNEGQIIALFQEPEIYTGYVMESTAVNGKVVKIDWNKFEEECVNEN